APTGASGLAGIAVTSVIFAAMHGPQWPAPIALFVLSFVIGYVYQRTGSLIAAICMHATFNGFSTLLLLGFLLVPQSVRDPKKADKLLVPSVLSKIDRDSVFASFETRPWFKKAPDLTGSGTFAGSARWVLRTTVPKPFLNQPEKRRFWRRFL